MRNRTPGPWSRKWIYGALRHINKNVDYDSFYFPDSDSEKDYNTPLVRGTNEGDSYLIAAAPELLEAAKLAVLNFERDQVSGGFLGDDEHEAWTALSRAIAKAEGEGEDL